MYLNLKFYLKFIFKLCFNKVICNSNFNEHLETKNNVTL